MKTFSAIFLVIFSVLLAYIMQAYQANQMPTFPECDRESYREFVTQLKHYANQSSVPGYQHLHGECAFSQTYELARSKFLHAIKQVGASHTSIPVGTDGLSIDVAEIAGSTDNFLISLSGVHGPEGFAGSAIQTSLIELISNSPEMQKLYNSAEESRKAPTLIFIHALNPYGFANNRRFNEDNIDVNRNFLTEKQFKEVMARDPNFAGYMDVDFMINPKSMPFGNNLFFNDIWGHLKSAYAVARYGITPIKRALVAGNYFRQSGLGFGGFKRSLSAETLINIAKIKNLHNAKKITLLDHHTGLGPSGTDTLALLGRGNAEFETMLDKMFPLEMDGDVIVGGAKASTAEGSAMSGYELTIGTVDDFCKTWMAPNADHTRDVLCITQEFGSKLNFGCIIVKLHV